MNLVEFEQADTCVVNLSRLEELEKKALGNESGKYRLCLHSGEQDLLHESIIVLTKRDNSQFIHKHLETSEMNMIIKGRLLVILFDEMGVICRSFVLEQGKKILFRIKHNQYHLSVPLSNIVVFLEIKSGPFDRSKNILPEWTECHVGDELYPAYIQKLVCQALDRIGENEDDIIQHAMY